MRASTFSVALVSAFGGAGRCILEEVSLCDAHPHDANGSWLLNPPEAHLATTYRITSATEKVSAHVGFYTKNGQFHPLIPPPTTELKIR